jgi:hypothetical protein
MPKVHILVETNSTSVAIEIMSSINQSTNDKNVGKDRFALITKVARTIYGSRLRTFVDFGCRKHRQDA